MARFRGLASYSAAKRCALRQPAVSVRQITTQRTAPHREQQTQTQPASKNRDPNPKKPARQPGNNPAAGQVRKQPSHTGLARLCPLPSLARVLCTSAAPASASAKSRVGQPATQGCIAEQRLPIPKAPRVEAGGSTTTSAKSTSSPQPHVGHGHGATVAATG